MLTPNSFLSATSSPMLIEADTLIYDNNDDTVTASGGRSCRTHQTAN